MIHLIGPTLISNPAVFNRWYVYHGWYARCR